MRFGFHAFLLGVSAVHSAGGGDARLDARGVVVHSLATVNDPRSHGVVGDHLLSLAEAILLTNRQLNDHSLSPAEQAQLGGFGTDIAFADIAVPLVTFERDLPVILDSPHGFTITGLANTVFDMRDTRGIVSTSDNIVDLVDLTLIGGEYGLRLTQSDTSLGSVIQGVVFEGQGRGGVYYRSTTPNSRGRLQFDVDCEFRDLPVAVLVDDIGAGRDTVLILNRVKFRGCETGLDLRIGPDGRESIEITRVGVENGDVAFRLSRVGTGSGRSGVLSGMHVVARGVQQRVFDLTNDPGTSSTYVLQTLDCGGPGEAIRMAPPSGSARFELLDSRIRGGMTLAASGAGSLLRVGHSEVQGSWVAWDASNGAVVEVAGCILDGAAATAAGTSSVRVANSVLLNGSVAGSPTSPVQLQGSFVSGTTLGANVAQSGALSARQLGRMDATPLEPRPGGVLTLQVDLPAGLIGFHVFGPVLDFPVSLPTGERLYLDLGRSALLPIAVRAQDRLPLPIPNSPALLGSELFVQLAVAPDPGVVAPALWLPPGRRIVFR
jgi:hypothetical protein